MGAQSQKQHDVLCRTSHGDRILDTHIRLFSLVEQPEEKDEVVMAGLSLLVELENLAGDLKCPKELQNPEFHFLEVRQVSQRYLKIVNFMKNTFYQRFTNITGKPQLVFCSSCGFIERVKPNEDWTDWECSLCGALHSMMM